MLIFASRFLSFLTRNSRFHGCRISCCSRWKQPTTRTSFLGLWIFTLDIFSLHLASGCVLASVHAGVSPALMRLALSIVGEMFGAERGWGGLTMMKMKSQPPELSDSSWERQEWKEEAEEVWKQEFCCGPQKTDESLDEAGGSKPQEWCQSQRSEVNYLIIGSIFRNLGVVGLSRTVWSQNCEN